MLNISQILIKNHCTIKEAIQRLDDTAHGVLLLIDDEGKLLRTITDGDIRRMLINNFSTDIKLHKLPDQKPIAITDNENSSDALAAMNAHQIDHLPVIDEQGIPIKLLHRRELSSQILLSTPHLGEYEQSFVAEAFKTNWIAPLGPNVNAFEKELAEYAGINHAAALSSGTAALHLAIRLLNIQPKDLILCSSFTFIASANPILYEGAIPVFIDSELESWNMSPKALERALRELSAQNKMPKAIIIANLYGQSSDMDPLLELCEHYNVPVIEDAAESLGATYKNRASGTFGKLGIYSFNGNKIITTSGGGALISNDQELIEKARFLSTQARDSAPYYQHSVIGYNYRMSNVLAGIGRGQLRVLGDRIAARKAVFSRYQQHLNDIEAIEWMPDADFGTSTRWLTAMTLNPKLTSVTPTELIAQLAKHNIEARHTWKPLHLQPLFEKNLYFTHDTNHSVADYLFAQGVCLPSGSNLKVEDQQRVIEVIRQCLTN